LEQGKWKEAKDEQVRALILAYQSCFDTPAGQVVLDNLEKVSGATPTVMLPEQAQGLDHAKERGEVNAPYTPMDVNALIRRDGMASVFYHIKTMVEHGQRMGAQSARAK
jgi:hypothetical protein